MNGLPITREGFEDLQHKLKKLKKIDRIEIIAEISRAREYGDLSENAEYKAAKEKQNFIENKILELERALNKCDIIDTKKLSNNTVKFGAFVEISSLEDNIRSSYQIVGEYEANLNKDKISIISPLAKALIKRSVGEIVKVHTPKGTKSYEILSIKY